MKKPLPLLGSLLAIFTTPVTAQNINFGSESGNPLTTSGTHLGVGWSLNVGTLSPDYFSAPTSNTSSVSWNYGAQTTISNALQTLTFDLTFDQPVDSLSFELLSFGSLAINLNAMGNDNSNGEQTFTFSAKNGATDLIFAESEITAGSLTTLSGFGSSTITGQAGIFDGNGTSDIGNDFRTIDFNLGSPVTSIQLTFSSEATGPGSLIGDSIIARSFQFIPVPEPSGVMLFGIAGTLLLARRKKATF